MFTFLLVFHAIIAAMLVTVILMQRSEGGGLTSGGSPAGLMSARGTADFLTRSTTILASLFVVVAIILAIIASTGHSTKINVTSTQTPVGQTAPASAPAPLPDSNAPFAQGAQSALANANAPTSNNAVPLAH